jgi:hypothetical protein
VGGHQGTRERMTYTVVWRNEARHALGRLRADDPASAKLLTAALRALADDPYPGSVISSAVRGSGGSGWQTSGLCTKPMTQTTRSISTASAACRSRGSADWTCLTDDRYHAVAQVGGLAAAGALPGGDGRCWRAAPRQVIVEPAWRRLRRSITLPCATRQWQERRRDHVNESLTNC